MIAVHFTAVCELKINIYSALADAFQINCTYWRLSFKLRAFHNANYLTQYARLQLWSTETHAQSEHIYTCPPPTAVMKIVLKINRLFNTYFQLSGAMSLWCRPAVSNPINVRVGVPARERDANSCELFHLTGDHVCANQRQQACAPHINSLHILEETYADNANNKKRNIPDKKRHSKDRRICSKSHKWFLLLIYIHTCTKRPSRHKTSCIERIVINIGASSRRHIHGLWK